jgi:hypothetical protein
MLPQVEDSLVSTLQQQSSSAKVILYRYIAPDDFLLYRLEVEMEFEVDLSAAGAVLGVLILSRHTPISLHVQVDLDQYTTDSAAPAD